MTDQKEQLSTDEYAVISMQASSIYVGLLAEYPHSMRNDILAESLIKQAVNIALMLNQKLNDKCDVVDGDVPSFVSDKNTGALSELERNKQTNALKIKKYLWERRQLIQKVK